MNNWRIIPSDKDLMHYGVLGMKWGVRRYQNKDGSLTSAGRKHYGSNDIKLKDKPADKSIIKTQYDIKKKVFEKNNDFLSADKFQDVSGYNKDTQEFYLDFSKKKKQKKKRILDAVTLGIKALEPWGKETNPNDPNQQWWFLFEDQTVGLPLITDLVNQGKTSGQIKSIIKEAKDLVDISNKLSVNNEAEYIGYESPYFDIMEASYGIDKFIDNCIKIKKGD